jgi:hypothetical protein
MNSNSNSVIGSLLTLKIPLGIVALFEKIYDGENSLKRDLSNDTTVNPPLFSFVNTFKAEKTIIFYGHIFFSDSLKRLNYLGDDLEARKRVLRSQNRGPNRPTQQFFIM